jgi:hypothetical protein
VAQVPDVAIRTLERDIRSLQLVLPGGRAPWSDKNHGGNDVGNGGWMMVEPTIISDLMAIYGD